MIGIESQDNAPEALQRRPEVQPRQHQTPVWLDLGCGTVKQASFIGLDRYPLLGVDVIVDFDQPLPFRDDSVDLVYASHSLEHVADLVAVMKEIYRVCRHGTQVCIVAPYYQQSLNLANPYHKQVFNEHTPRFWTNVAAAPLPAAEFAHPHAAMWGLSESDSRTSGIDLRCLRMEFFYFPAYRDLSPEEQRAARQKYLDVCDQIMFHLLVVKHPIDEAEVQRVTAQIHYYDPPFTQIRRLRESHERQEQQVRILQEAVVRRDAELRDLRTVLASTQEELQRITESEKTQATSVRELHAQLSSSQQATQDLQQLLTISEKKLIHVEGSLTVCENELAQVQTSFATSQQTTLTREAELEQMCTQVAILQQRLARFAQYQQSAVAELRAFRRHHETRRLARFHPGGDLRNEIDPAFQQLKDDSLLFTRTLKGFCLQPSTDLQAVPFLAYPLDLPHPGLSGVLLAPILDFPVEQGRLGIEIVSPAHTIVAQTVIPFAEVDVRVPTCFRFAPISSSHQGRFWLRVFVRDVTDPVRVFEWRKYRGRGFGPLQTRAFCGFLFA